MCTTYPDRPRGAGPGETDATPAPAEGHGRATRITHHTSPAWRPPRGLRGLAGLRADAPSEARGADGSRAGRPRGGRKSVGATNNAERPPPTGTPSSPARRTAHATPATPVGPQHHTAARQPNTPRRHNKTARPHRGRAAQPISVTHRRITTMSGSPRPLSWRTLEMPSLAATSFAVPSMRRSS